MKVRLRISPAEMTRTIDAAISQGANLLSPADARDAGTLYAGFQAWDKRNQLILDSNFETKSVFTQSPKTDYADFRDLKLPFGQKPTDLTVNAIEADIRTKIARLEFLKGNLDIYDPPKNDPATDSVPTPGSAAAADRPTIFIIHGQNDKARLEVQNLLLKATAHKSIVLMEQPNRGATIIEKLDTYLGNGAGFAIAILTGDDRGSANKKKAMLSPRARQNVILELGYAMGKIGRKNVALLYEEGVELPSDMHGVTYYALDAAGAWKNSLVGELIAAGFKVDRDALFG